MPDFASMNETDVREIVVRPFLHELGYEHGTEATIKTEQTFRYSKAFLGRKNEKKDPDLAGRADYILEVSAVGRWVVEVKAPTVELSRDDIEQAHTYAAHPEVSADYFLLTNGRSFRLHRTAFLETPVMAWEYEQTTELFPAISNILSPDALRRRAIILQPDTGKPLARGYPSTVRVVGGYVRYENHQSPHPLFPVEDVNGLELPVTGGAVDRTDDGRIRGIVHVAKAMPMVGDLMDLLNRDDGYDFFSNEEYISVDRENPTIFQNFVSEVIPEGTMVKMPGMGEMPTLWNMGFNARTTAIGFIEENRFQGTMELAYEFRFSNIPIHIRAALEQHFGKLPEIMTMGGGGTFEVELLDR